MLLKLTIFWHTLSTNTIDVTETDSTRRLFSPWSRDYWHVPWPAVTRWGPQMVTELVRGEWAEIKFIMLRFCNSRDQNTLWRGHKNYFPQPLGSRGVLRAVMMSPLLSHVVPQFPHYPLCARSFSRSAEGVTSKWSSRFCHAGHI